MFPNWKIRVAQNVLEGAQWNVSLRVNVFPYGAISVWLVIAGHFPRGAEAGAVSQALHQLDPGGPRAQNSLITNRIPTSPHDLVRDLGQRVASSVLGRATWDLDRDAKYSILVLNETSPQADPEHDYGPLAGLSTGIPRWEQLAPDILDTYRASDYGLFKSDFSFIRHRRTLAFLPDHEGFPESRLRRKKVSWWLARPAELSLLQMLIYRAYSKEISETRAKLLRARLEPWETLRNMFKRSFLQATPFLFLEDLESFPSHLPAGALKLYEKIAAADGLEAEQTQLRNQVTGLVRESSQWTAPAQKALERVLDISKTIPFL